MNRAATETAGHVDHITYDVVVIGGGPVGENVADRARAGGLSVAIVERELVGGECSYWACIPSKAMLRPLVALADAQRVEGAREAVTGPLDAKAVLARRDRIVGNWDDTGQADWVKGIGADLIRGHGRLDGVRRVAVTTADDRLLLLNARHAVAVCTGTAAALPDMPGIAEARAWTNRKGTDSQTVPGRLAVVGGGPVGVEMATAWQGLGAKVTLLARESYVLPRFEAFVGESVGASMREAGIEVRNDVTVTSVRRADPAGPVTLYLDDGGELEADEVLFAVGRVPLTSDIGLEKVGLEPGSWLNVDDTCRVRGLDGDWLYAAGDVNRRALLTHQGKYQARIVGDAVAAKAAGRPVDDGPWGQHAATADGRAVAQVVFTDPEAASVGLTADEAHRAGFKTRVVDVDLGRSVAGASLYADGYKGHARMVVDTETEQIVGATFVGSGVSELLHSATIAVAGQVPISRLWHAVPSFPTVSEVWLRLLEGYRG